MKIIIIGSGKGSNAEAIIQSKKNNLLGNTEITSIISDKADSGILEIAKRYKIKSNYYDAGQSVFLEDNFENSWIKKIDLLNPDLIVLAGFMKILKPTFIESVNYNIINLHPSLLPSFKGLNAIERAFKKGVKIAGCTVHWVNEGVDEGKIIAQAPVRIMENDSLDMVKSRIHAAEHILLPETIRNLSIKYSDS
tara:strand:+ start:409 stop:990 length:582 start_codon:yes stop_codon:yes gene_type:complete